MKEKYAFFQKKSTGSNLVYISTFIQKIWILIGQTHQKSLVKQTN